MLAFAFFFSAACPELPFIVQARAAVHAAPGQYEPAAAFALLSNEAAFLSEAHAALDAVVDDPALAWVRKAELYMRWGTREQALAAHRKSHALRPDARNLHRLAPLLVDLGLRDEAVAACLQALRGAGSELLADAIAFECFAGIAEDGWAPARERAVFRERLLTEPVAHRALRSMRESRAAWRGEKAKEGDVDVDVSCSRASGSVSDASGEGGAIACPTSAPVKRRVKPGTLLWLRDEGERGVAWALVHDRTTRVSARDDVLEAR